MKTKEVDRCQIQEWYPKFKSDSIKTEIHELPESFIEYLLDDSKPFVLPVSIYDKDALPNRVSNPVDEEDFVVSEGSDDESVHFCPPSFPELEADISRSIESVGGAVFLKLNWSSPKDAAWISSSGSLRCSSFSEIVLLLRSSDSLVHDLCHAYDSCDDKISDRPEKFFLALKKWQPALRPEMEFRCFIKNKRLVGVSQRETTTFYPVLLEKKDHLKILVQNFFTERVCQRFPLDDYTFDIYIIRDDKIKFLDFNPWGAFTLPLLFSWEELEENSGEGECLDLRIVESRLMVRLGLKTAVPYDYLDTSAGSGWDEFLRNANDELLRQASDPEAGA